MSMISELRDEEILDFLMTSDFEEDYKPEELKYLLVKWRYFYRILSGKSETSITDKDGQIKRLKEDNDTKDKQIESLMVNNAYKDDMINSLKNRDLTWKERFSGKIITKENENK